MLFVLFVNAVCSWWVRVRSCLRRGRVTLKLWTRLCTGLLWVKTRISDHNVLETVFVAVGLAGVGAIFWPAALILCGVLGVVACERSAQRRAESVHQRDLRRVA